MPIRKWILQYLIALPLLFVMLAGVQYLKGRGLDYAISFGLLWAPVTLGIFAVTRVYYFRKGQACQLCNDLPSAAQPRPVKDKTY